MGYGCTHRPSRFLVMSRFPVVYVSAFGGAGVGLEARVGAFAGRIPASYVVHGVFVQGKGN